MLEFAGSMLDFAVLYSLKRQPLSPFSQMYRNPTLARTLKPQALPLILPRVRFSFPGAGHHLR